MLEYIIVEIAPIIIAGIVWIFILKMIWDLLTGNRGKKVKK